MKPLLRNDPDTILAYVRDWVQLLSEDKFDEAQEWVYVPPELVGKYCNDPNLTRKAIDEHSLEYRRAKKSEKEKHRPKVTSPYAMNLDKEEYYFWPEDWREREKPINGIEYYLPLDGQWSQLRAHFELIALPDNTFGMFMSDISVP